MAKGFFRPDRQQCSGMHRKVRDILRDIFPGFTVGEEVSMDAVVDGRPTKLFVDLVVKEMRVAVECHGRQHYQYTPHFHHTMDGFRAHQRRDQAKADAIRRAGYSLVVIRYDEEGELHPESVKQKILTAFEE